MNREAFLGRIAMQNGRAQPLREAPARSVQGVPNFWRAFALSRDERIACFEDRLVLLGGEVKRVQDVAALPAALADVIAHLQPRRIGVWNDDALKAMVTPVLGTAEWVTWGIDPPQAFHSIDIGITGCSAAVADTGTLVLACGGGRGRSVHLLPPVHVAIVGASQVVTRLGEAFEQVADPHAMVSYLHFVTGPSRSSDIENDQTIGIHGPAAVIVLLVEDL
ncbi:MAG: lactate utilization protein C [Firmicutes bacterium]|nr:lactate utilization protein C [Bacillota bacterium]